MISRKIAIAAACTASFGALDAVAQDSSPAVLLDEMSLSLTAAFESEYVFRGTELGDESFQPGIEAGVPLAVGDLYAGVWTSQDISGTPSNEIDIYAGYTVSLTDVLALDGGFTYYWYPDEGSTPNREREFYAGISADVPAQPALYLYYNLTYEQILLELNVSHTVALTERSALELYAYAGSANADDANSDQAPGKPQNGYWYWGASADVVYALNETTAASLGARFSALEDGESVENLWWGASISMGF